MDDTFWHVQSKWPNVISFHVYLECENVIFFHRLLSRNIQTCCVFFIYRGFIYLFIFFLMTHYKKSSHAWANHQRIRKLIDFVLLNADLKYLRHLQCVFPYVHINLIYSLSNSVIFNNLFTCLLVRRNNFVPKCNAIQIFNKVVYRSLSLSLYENNWQKL